MINKCVLLLLTVVVVAARVDRDCTKYNDDWRITECASVLLKDGYISKETYREYLLYAAEMDKESGNFYGLGITTGNDKYVLAGRMSKPVLRSGIGFSYDPSEIYFTKLFLDIGEQFDKPILLYLVNDIDGVPEWNSNFFSRMIPSGSEGRYAIFKAEKSGKIDPNGDEGCSRMSKWIDENLERKNKGVAIVMGQETWCPVLKERLTGSEPYVTRSGRSVKRPNYLNN